MAGRIPAYVDMYRNRTLSAADIDSIKSMFRYPDPADISLKTNSVYIRALTADVNKMLEMLNPERQEAASTNKAAVVTILIASKVEHTRDELKAELKARGYSDAIQLNGASANQRIELIISEKHFIAISNKLSLQVLRIIATAIGMAQHKLTRETAEMWRLGKIREAIDLMNGNEEDERIKKLREQLGELVDNQYNKVVENKISNMVTDYNNTQHEIDELQDRINLLTDTLRLLKKDIVYAKFEGKDENKRKELINSIMLLKDKIKDIKITKTTRNETVMDIQNELYLDLFDDEAAKSLSLSPRHNAFNYHDDAGQLMRDLFVDKKCKFKITARTMINLDTGRILATGEETGRMGNPHHDFYTCYGEYVTPIREAALKGEYSELIYILVTAQRGLNVVDSPVVDRLYRKLSTTNIKCIEYNGTLYTPTEYARKKVEENETA